jgi:hypothetical protein
MVYSMVNGSKLPPVLSSLLESFHSHWLASSKTTSQEIVTQPVWGSKKRNALEPLSYPTKIILELLSSSFFRCGRVFFTCPMQPNVRR